MNGTSANHVARLATAVREDDRRRATERRRIASATAESGPKAPALTSTSGPVPTGPSWRRGALGRIVGRGA